MTTLLIMSIFKDILVLQNEVCYHGNQHAAVYTEETAHAYDPIHLDYMVALTKRIDNIILCALNCYPAHFSL